MFGQMTAGLVDLHRHAGDPPGHVPDLRRRGREALRLADLARAHDPHGRARRDGRRAAARRRRWPARRSSASRSTRRGSSGGSRRATSTRRPTRSTTRSRACGRPRPRAARSRSACSGTRPTSCPSSRARGEHFDLVTDQTAAHDPLTGYVPRGLLGRGGRGAARVRSGRVPPPRARVDRRRTSRAMLEYVRRGAMFSIMATTCEGRPHEGGRRGRLLIPGLRPGLYPAALLPRRRAVPLGRALGRPGRHRGDRRGAAAAVPRRRAAAAVARARARARRLPGAAGADLLARLRRPRQGGPRDQRARPLAAR